MARQIILFLIFSLCVLGPTGVMAAAAFASITALGRNPSAAPKIFMAMTITLIFAEALAIVAMLIVYQLFTAG
jgi:F0F1-type ATP synthase membrane subunit c/vacuolar-type H+-ATPase subunit K